MCVTVKYNNKQCWLSQGAGGGGAGGNPPVSYRMRKCFSLFCLFVTWYFSCHLHNKTLPSSTACLWRVPFTICHRTTSPWQKAGLGLIPSHPLHGMCTLWQIYQASLAVQCHDWKMGTAVSYMKCSRMADLIFIHIVGRSNCNGVSLRTTVLLAIKNCSGHFVSHMHEMNYHFCT